MHRTKAFTLTEVLIVVLIILILSGLFYAVMAPARVKAKQTTCMGNLSQLYKAVSLYSADFEDGPNSDLIDGHVGLQSGFREALMPYGVTKSQFFCPQIPFDASTKMYTSYVFLNLGLDRMASVAGAGVHLESSVEMLQKMRKEAGDKMPLIYCGSEDELIYQKSDPEGVSTPFIVYITTTGSAHAERVKFVPVRPKLLSLVFPGI